MKIDNTNRLVVDNLFYVNILKKMSIKLIYLYQSIEKHGNRLKL